MLSFIGHSIGAYIVLDILQRSARLAPACVSATLLMPFIAWSSLPALHRLNLTAVDWAPEAVTQWLAMRFQAAVQAMPLPTRTHMLARLQGGQMDRPCVTATAARLFTRRLLANLLSMGRDEIRQVPLNEERMLSIISRLSGSMQVFALYTDNDVWAPEADCARLRACGPYVRTAFVPHVRHAFTMQRSTYVPVSAIMERWAEQTLRGFRPRRGTAGDGGGGEGGGEGKGERGTNVMVTSKL